MTLFLTALILGLTANLHCLGMCGPLAMAVPLDRSSNRTILFGLLQYNAGRILTYALLGLLVGLIGITIRTFGVLQWVSILSGFGIIAYAWRKWLGFRFFPNVSWSFFNRFAGRMNARLWRSASLFRLPLLGMINGLLPCGMVYLGLLNAVLAGKAGASALAMVFFGLGTLPVMLFAGFAANRISNRVRLKLTSALPYLLTLTGLLVVLRGLNLGIPYLSPEITISSPLAREENADERKSPEIEMNCCKHRNDCRK